MAENAHTPVPYWLSMTLSEFSRWIDASNKLFKRRELERKKRLKQIRKQ